VKRHIAGLPSRNDPELPEVAASEFFLHLGALYKRHAAHLHRAPDHSSRVTLLFLSKPADQAAAFARFRFSDYAGHYKTPFLCSMRKIAGIARKGKSRILAMQAERRRSRLGVSPRGAKVTLLR
jgi:hypothetical protein